MKQKQIILIIFTFLLFYISSYSQLTTIAQTRISQLNQLIEQAENQGIDATKEKMSIRTAEAFLVYADWDEANVDENEAIYKLLPSGTSFYMNAKQLAENLADYERSQVILMLNDAIQNINKLINGEIIRKPTKKIDWTALSISGNQVVYNSKPVFLSDYNLKPETFGDGKDLTEFFGNKDVLVLRPSHVSNSSGNLQSLLLTELASKPTGTFGDVFINNSVIPDWAEDEFGPDFKMRENTFIRFDIDNPGAKTLFNYLLEGVVPQTMGKNYSTLGYLLANEPHFFTTIDNPFQTGSVSDYTINKFRNWLSEKHTTIANLNTIWNTNYTNFNSINLTIPLDTEVYERGGPIYYDWIKFNLERVTEWFTYLHNKIKELDANAKTHIKIIPDHWVGNSRASGIDLEELTYLTDISGNDASSQNSLLYGGPEPWQEDYSFYWEEISMSYDFMRSVSPNKIIYNSETHFLSGSNFRDLYLDPAYVKAAFWLATLHGMNVSQNWFWSRRENGSPSSTSLAGFGGSLNQQPRVVNEIEGTFIDLNSVSEDMYQIQNLRKPLRIFYSKTSVINKEDHMSDAVFRLYEALNFEGIPLGFATKNIILEQDNSQWDAIVIWDTEFVKKDELQALQTYLDNGGTIIKDAISLTKNEYGVAHTNSLTPSNGTLITRTLLQNFVSKAIDFVKNNNGLPVITVDENNSGKKGCFWRALTNNAGENIISIINLGKEDANITLSLLNNNNSVNVTNHLTGESLEATFKMNPYETRLLKVTDATLSNSDISKVEGLEFYPNPTLNSIIFSSQNVINKATIYNTLGQKLMSINGKSKSLKVNLSHLQQGIYFAKIDAHTGSEIVSIIKK